MRGDDVIVKEQGNVSGTVVGDRVIVLGKFLATSA
jgi:hypothetical protein